MSLAELEKLHSLVQDATGPEAVFPVLREGRVADADTAVSDDKRAADGDALEKEYVRLTKLASPDRYVGDPIAQGTARRVLARLYELHQQALDILGIFDSMDSDDSRRAVSTISTQSPAA